MPVTVTGKCPAFYLDPGDPPVLLRRMRTSDWLGGGQPAKVKTPQLDFRMTVRIPLVRIQEI